MVLNTTSGAVVGEQSVGGMVFRGIRYGNLANGQRFDPIVPAVHESTQDLREFPAVFPQLPSRLDTLLGAGWRKHPQEEDAFLLNVCSPFGASDRPLLFFIHGGGFVSGGGVLPWYLGSRLACDGDMVVVTMNYRLGPLAHLLIGSDGDDANRSVDDLLQALTWVRENIHLFGGDPENLVVAGQSAGAFYAQILALLPESRGLIRRLILMSAPGIPASSRGRAEALSAEVIENLRGADPRTAPIQSLLASHQHVMKEHVQFGSVAPTCLMPTVDARIPDWLGNPASIVKEMGVTDLLVTFTHDETGAYFFNSREQDITIEQLRQLGFERTAAYDTPYAELVALTTASLFGNHASGLVAAARVRGISAELREFNLRSPVDGLGSCHGFDMPFLFGNRDAWSGAHMLDGVDDDVFEAEGGILRSAVRDFVHLD